MLKGVQWQKKSLQRKKGEKSETEEREMNGKARYF